MVAVDDEGQDAGAALLGVRAFDVGIDPARLVGARQHLAHPQDGELALDRVGGDAVGDAGAGAAAVDAQHQARLVRRAAPGVQGEAEHAVIAADMGLPALDHVDRRVPHQGAIAEHPRVGAGGDAFADHLERGAARLLRHQRHAAARHRGIGDAAHALGREILAPQVAAQGLDRLRGFFGLQDFVRHLFFQTMRDSRFPQ